MSISKIGATIRANSKMTGVRTRELEVDAEEVIPTELTTRKTEMKTTQARILREVGKEGVTLLVVAGDESEGDSSHETLTTERTKP